MPTKEIQTLRKKESLLNIALFFLSNRQKFGRNYQTLSLNKFSAKDFLRVRSLCPGYRVRALGLGFERRAGQWARAQRLHRRYIPRIFQSLIAFGCPYFKRNGAICKHENPNNGLTPLDHRKQPLCQQVRTGRRRIIFRGGHICP